jgi:hypothetical protein
MFVDWDKSARLVDLSVAISGVGVTRRFPIIYVVL